MALFRRDFGGGAGVQLGIDDVIDDHLGVVLLTPLLDEHVVEPLVVGRNEVFPLHDLERLLARRARLLRRVDERTCEGRRTDGFDELSAPETSPETRIVTRIVVVTHGSTPRRCRRGYPTTASSKVKGQGQGNRA